MPVYHDYYSYVPNADLFLGAPPENQNLNTHLGLESSSQKPNLTSECSHDVGPNQSPSKDGWARMERNINQMKNSLLNLLSHSRLQEEKTEAVEGLLKKILDRLPEKETETTLNYTFVPYEEVVRLHEAYPTNPRAFVRALEVLTYQDQVYELQTAVNKRLFTLDRVEFIRKCLFRHYAVPPHLQEDVWRSVRASLDNRSLRLKHLIRARQRTGFRTSTPISDLLEGLDQLENGPDRQIVI
ncbi:unnamed protein product [Haemonchus placei]|uniref:Vacuolar protein sorting-associated protein 52 homolog n=1 Tax=Haemonchus placei TaxID=6290 RepID=A0A0N4W583_HAEPC|nr:unnamed protein product [Haemonchus placei]